MSTPIRRPTRGPTRGPPGPLHSKSMHRGSGGRGMQPRPRKVIRPLPDNSNDYISTVCGLWVTLFQHELNPDILRQVYRPTIQETNISTIFDVSKTLSDFIYTLNKQKLLLQTHFQDKYRVYYELDKLDSAINPECIHYYYDVLCGDKNFQDINKIEWFDMNNRRDSDYIRPKKNMYETRRQCLVDLLNAFRIRQPPSNTSSRTAPAQYDIETLADNLDEAPLEIYNQYCNPAENIPEISIYALSSLVQRLYAFAEYMS